MALEYESLIFDRNPYGIHKVELHPFEASVAINHQFAMDSQEYLHHIRRKLVSEILKQVEASIIFETQDRMDSLTRVITAKVMLPVESRSKIKKEVEQEIRQEHIVL